MKHKTERIDGIVKSVIKTLSKESNPASGDIEKIWKEIAGKKAFSHTRPASLRKGRFIVNVDDSSWLYELTLRKSQLLADLKSRLGKDKIEELQFRIGEL